MALVCLPLWDDVASRFGGFAWLVYPLLALGATLGLLVAFIAALTVLALVRNLRMRYEKPSLAFA